MKVLLILDKIVKWDGRYPVALKFDPTRPVERICVEPIASPLPAVASIYDKSLKEMHRICSQFGERTS
jgi:hypothetical protein